ncbi:MAG TPA: T9SS type A sorting domain-containing protein [Edaphocola sp.]|nr:T9SS type A sorting domain-containing protein [Edaphocola sp.]
MNKNFLGRSVIISASFALLLGHTASAGIPRPAVGKWMSYLPYRTVIDFDTDDNRHFYCVSRSSFFVYDVVENATENYSKANGMSDVDMAFVTFDDKTEKVVLIYANGNIDLFSNGSFENIPDVKVSTVSGDKSLNGAFAHEGKLYLSANLGMIVANLEKKQIDETVPFFDGSVQGQVKAVTGHGQSVIAATSVGLFTTAFDNPQISNYNTWTKLSGLPFEKVAVVNGQILAVSAHTVYHVSGTSVNAIHELQQGALSAVPSKDNALWITTTDTSSSRPYALKIDVEGNVLDSIGDFFSYKIYEPGDGNYWSADGYNGLTRRSSSQPGESWTAVSGGGPYSREVEAIWAKNGELWLAHGGKSYNSWRVSLSQDAFSRYVWEWRNWKWDILSMLDPDKQFTLTDAVDILKDELGNDVYVAYYNSGLVHLDAQERITIYKEGYLDPDVDGPFAAYRVSSLALDDKRNLWLTQSYAQHALHVKTKEGDWYHYAIPGIDHLASIAIDDLGQKWMAAGLSMDGGLVVYNDNGTLDNPNDDRYINIRASDATKLPSNAVNVIVKDLNGVMWVGTEDGLVSFSCGVDIQKAPMCAASHKVLVAKGFNFNSHLFEGIAVKALAVDGGNRKWVGTNVGLFLLSDDMEEMLEYFTETNSPLLSNQIKELQIDPVTGVLFIATDKGLCAYGGTAAEAERNMDERLITFPNPVPSGYNGLISIKGFTRDAEVKITDISGQLVYQGRSNGGQFSWNGKDYKGQKVQSGVYLVFAVSADGMEKTTGKFIIHE